MKVDLLFLFEILLSLLINIKFLISDYLIIIIIHQLFMFNYII